jgi:site-specific DNA recombinase
MSPAKPKRMDGYIRVSRVGSRDTESESYITEAVQREKIETWAKLRGVEIAAWHIDRDASGAKLTRPGFDACMARIRDGKTEGIVVAQIDRLSRADVADALMIVRKVIDDHGGMVAAVDLGIDPTTEVGEMLLTVLLALARMQWRRYAAAWATAKDRAIKRGAHVGPTPYGYSRDKDGRLVPHIREADTVTEAFRICAAQGLRDAGAYLREADPDARSWDSVSVRRLIASRTYLGEVRVGSVVNTDAHEPLVDLATWTGANRRARGVQGRRPNGEYTLSQAVACASCGSPLVGMRIGNSKPAYGCRRNRSAAVRRGEQEPCPAPALASAAALEELVQASLVRYVATERPDEAEVLVAGSDQAAVERAEAALRSAELERDRDARDTRLRDTLGEEAFYARLEAHNGAVEAAGAIYAAAVETAASEIVWPLTDEVATARTRDLPRLLERVGVTVKLAPGRGNLPERLTLEAA